MNGDAAFASSFLCFSIFSADLKKLHPVSGILLYFSAYGDDRRGGDIFVLDLFVDNKNAEEDLACFLF